jgi:hypothetical protein
MTVSFHERVGNTSITVIVITASFDEWWPALLMRISQSSTLPQLTHRVPGGPAVDNLFRRPTNGSVTNNPPHRAHTIRPPYEKISIIIQQVQCRNRQY